jgi:hypothetical protein
MWFSLLSGEIDDAPTFIVLRRGSKQADNGGGGAYILFSTMTVTNSSVDGNSVLTTPKFLSGVLFFRASACRVERTSGSE